MKKPVSVTKAVKNQLKSCGINTKVINNKIVVVIKLKNKS